jgi:hypothetical protein
VTQARELAGNPAHLVCFDLLQEPDGPLPTEPLATRRCVLTDWLRAQFVTRGRIHADLLPLIDALAATHRPRSVLAWLDHVGRGSDALAAIARSGRPVTPATKPYTVSPSRGSGRSRGVSSSTFSQNSATHSRSLVAEALADGGHAPVLP